MSYINQYPQSFTLIESNQLIIYLVTRTLPLHMFVSSLPLYWLDSQALLLRALRLYTSLCAGEVDRHPLCPSLCVREVDRRQQTFWGHMSPSFGGRGHFLLILVSTNCPIGWISIPNPELRPVWCWSKKLARHDLKNVVLILYTLNHRSAGEGLEVI